MDALVDEEHAVVMANRGLVRTIAATVKGVDLGSEDVFQAGVLGLMRAVRDYDPTRGVKFSTYAAYWIRQSVLDHMWHDRMIRAPRYLAGKAGAACKCHGREVAARGVATASEGWRDGSLPEPWREADAEAEEDERVSRLRRAVSLLPPREAEVVRRRMAGETLADVGAAMGVTHSRVGQVERQAHGRLREMLAGAEG